jgi:hypothetical protein
MYLECMCSREMGGIIMAALIDATVLLHYVPNAPINSELAWKVLQGLKLDGMTHYHVYLLRGKNPSDSRFRYFYSTAKAGAAATP